MGIPDLCIVLCLKSPWKKVLIGDWEKERGVTEVKSGHHVYMWKNVYILEIHIVIYN